MSLSARARAPLVINATAAALLAVVASIAVVRASQPDVAYVYSYEGNAASYSVVHAGKAEHVAPFLPLQSGDRIGVIAQPDTNGNTLALTLSIGGQHVRVTSANSPFCIGPKISGCAANAMLTSGASNPVLTVLKNVLTSIAPIFGEAQEDYYSAQQETMTGHRGIVEPPTVPMLAPSVRAFAKPGPFAPAFAWLGGKPPFSVQLTGLGCSAKKTNVSANNVSFGELQLAPGATCRVNIEDAGHRSVSGMFEVVSLKALPKLAIDQVVGDAGLPPNISENTAVIRASELAGKGVRWYMAAYQTLAALPDDPEHRVHQLRDWLAEGQPAPRP